MSRGLRAWAPALAWAALIFAASARPTVPVDLSGGWDKLAHLGAYFVLGILLARAVRPALGVIALGWAYALSDEIHQTFVPGRTFEAADWAADAVGVLLGLFLYHRLRRGAASRAPSRAAAESSSS